MPTTTNKQRVLTHLFTTLKKRYDPPEAEPLPVLEQMLLAVLREGTTRDKAERALRSLRERFFDWNEIRVSSHREIEEVIAELPGAELRSQRIISLLQEIFETTFSFDLGDLEKKGLKKAAKQLGRYQAANDYAVSWVIQQALGGHALPLDSATIRCLRRLGILDDDQEDLEALRASVEHLIPKAKGTLFIDLVSSLADDLCTEEDPDCPSCPLCSDCPYGREHRMAVASERGHRAKPR